MPAYSGQSWENPPYKGDWLKIGYSHEERDEPEYLKPQISSQMASSSLPYTLNGVRKSPRIEPSSMGGTGHPGMADDKGRRWEK